MSEWKKRGTKTVLDEIVAENAGVPLCELLAPTLESPQNIDGMYEAAVKLSDAITNKTPITIVGDYDSDGLNAMAILMKLCRYYSVSPKAIIPRRVTDGYGLSDNIVAKIDGGLVITIDNGITAVDQVAALKAKGCTVVILDHHLPGERIPEADVVVDPHISEKSTCFADYCGAGLGLQLARLMLAKDTSKAGANLLAELTIHAAIATVTDVMPMLGPNRHIVRDGLRLLNDPMLAKVCGGLSAIRMAAKAERVDEDTIGYRIGPLLNAPARLYDNGGLSVLKALVCDDFSVGCEYAVKMTEINQNRKDLVKQYAQQASAYVEELTKAGPLPNPLVVCLDDVPEGIVGIVAGNLTTKYRRSTFVFTRTADRPDLFKGSGRAYGNDDLSVMVEAVRPISETCGGHVGAAGLSVKQEYIQAVTDTLQEVGMDNPTADDTVYYDVEATIAEIPALVSTQARLAPFGYKCPKPTVLIRSITPDDPFRTGHYRLIGEAKDSVKFSCGGVDIVGFGLAEKYAELGNPPCFDALCTIGTNTFNGRTSVQISLIDIAV